MAVGNSKNSPAVDESSLKLESCKKRPFLEKFNNSSLNVGSPSLTSRCKTSNAFNATCVKDHE